MSVQSPPKQGFSRLVQIASYHPFLVISSMVLSSLAAVVSFVPYLAIFVLMREVLSVYPDLSALNASAMARIGIIAALAAVLQIIIYFAALMCSHLAAFGTLYDLKINFASHLSNLPLGIHVLYGSGRLRKVMDENIEKIEGFIAHQLPDLTAAVTAPIVMLVILLSFDWRYGLLATLGLLLAIFVQFSAYGNDGAKAMVVKYQDALEEMNNASVEYIRGIAVIKAYKQTVYSFKRLKSTISKYTELIIPYTLSWENYMSGFQTIIHNSYLLLLPLGIWELTHTTDYKASLLTFLFYLVFVPASAGILLKLMYVTSDAMRIVGGIERMDEVLHMPVLLEPTSPKMPSSFDIAFENVSYSYNEKDESGLALKGVNFTARAGQLTAIVGPSGSGKTTIAHLIPRFFDVNLGKITIGGIDIRQIASSELMKQVSFVFQDVFLFRQSILDNIAMGSPIATRSDVIAAAKAAQCHDFILALPNGYDTIVGTKGIHLSGGERQRIAIARAIVKDSPIIVLDEATAYADSENEHLIQKAFETLTKDKTVIVIAHRLSTIVHAQQIVVMDQGEVVEIGTHETLVSQGGRYENMWRQYSASLSWKLNDSEKTEAKTC